MQSNNLQFCKGGVCAKTKRGLVRFLEHRLCQLCVDQAKTRFELIIFAPQGFL